MLTPGLVTSFLLLTHVFIPLRLQSLRHVSPAVSLTDGRLPGNTFAGANVWLTLLLTHLLTRWRGMDDFLRRARQTQTIPDIDLLGNALCNHVGLHRVVGGKIYFPAKQFARQSH